jgi:O-antigen/teichoic acid export membrane protein
MPDRGAPLDQPAVLDGEQGALARAFAVAWRYGISTIGLTSISAAHFFVSLLFLHALAPAAFGLLSFVFVIVPLCLSSAGALLSAPVAAAVARSGPPDSLRTLLKANAAFSLLAAAIVGLLVLASGAAPGTAVLFGIYGGAMSLRWFARSYAYATLERARSAVSDVTYSVLLAGGIVLLLFLHELSMRSAASVMTLSSCIALIPFGLAFLRRQLSAISHASLRGYAPIWRELTRWSFLGVVSTELTANAHAYLVNLVSGANAFALIAVGSLFLRPVLLCLSALPDLERPAMTRQIVEGDYPAAERGVRDMLIATGGVWIGTLALVAALLAWWPSLLLHHEYDERSVVIVTALWATIVAVRMMRSPNALLLQAAGDFRVLAKASVHSSVVSVVATGVLLALFGPIASLGGILAGDTVLTARILFDARRLRARFDTAAA